MKFNKSEVDPVKLHQETQKLTDTIYDSLANHRNFNINESKIRSKPAIYKTTEQGLVAELYLLDNGYTDNPEKYGDVFSPGGVKIEVKSTTRNHNLDQLMEDLRIKIIRYNPSKIMYLFTITGSQYTFYKAMDMSSGRFIVGL